MIRSLWTAASGMTSMQRNVDTISNNLANVNTFGYKKERMEFKTLLYETMRRADLDPANQTGRPVNLQVGLGVRPIAVSRTFTTGNLQTTSSNQDIAIEGDGFFEISRGTDDKKYTRDGALKFSAREDGGLMLVSSEGYPIMSTDNEPVVIPTGVLANDVLVDEFGTLTYSDKDGVTQELGFQLKIVQFPNPQGLEAVGSNLFAVTSASGQPIAEADGDVPKPSRIIQGAIEMSNVQVAEEMVSLIIAQRAYDLNAKAITTSDAMLATANDLKR